MKFRTLRVMPARASATANHVTFPWRGPGQQVRLEEWGNSALWKELGHVSIAASVFGVRTALDGAGGRSQGHSGPRRHRGPEAGGRSEPCPGPGEGPRKCRSGASQAVFG